MIIDIHAHIAYYKLFPRYFLRDIVEDVRNSLISREQYNLDLSILESVLRNTLQDKDCFRLLEQMKKANISKTVLLIADFAYNKNDIEFSIEDIYKFYYKIYKLHSDKFIVFAGIDPRRGEDGLEIFKRGILEYNFKGLKLYPPCGFELNDPEVYPFYDLCKNYDIPVITHTGPSAKSMRTEIKYPESILTVSKEYQEVDFILAHAGILDFERTVDLAKKRENIYLDISGFQKHFKNKKLIEERILKLMNKMPDKILWGSDWPMFNLNGSQDIWVSIFSSIKGLKDNLLESLFYSNAKRILKL